ncbi:hypothetical protein GGF50DRAFT_121421 [Schizophyllum commune]
MNRECRELEDTVGYAQQHADLAGSDECECFPCHRNNKLKLRRVDLATYALQRLHPPIPSFIHSMFLGHIGPTEMLLEIGMNSISVLACTEQDNLLEVSDGYKVRAKLVPEPVPGSTTLSKIDRH